MGESPIDEANLIATTERTRQPSSSRIGPSVCIASLVFLLSTGVWAGSLLFGVNLFRQPELALDPARIDLGDVPPETVIPCVVKIRNVGGGYLALAAVKGSCDACIRIKSLPANAIRSQHQEDIHFEIDTGNSPGPVNKQIVIFSNSWRGGSTKLKCSWNINAVKTNRNISTDGGDEQTISK